MVAKVHNKRFDQREPFKFVQEVRQEVAKVTWPTRNETWVTTIAVLIMITLASIFFMLADQIMGWLVSIILGIDVS